MPFGVCQANALRNEREVADGLRAFRNEVRRVVLLPAAKRACVCRIDGRHTSAVGFPCSSEFSDKSLSQCLCAAGCCDRRSPHRLEPWSQPALRFNTSPDTLPVLGHGPVIFTSSEPKICGICPESVGAVKNRGRMVEKEPPYGPSERAPAPYYRGIALHARLQRHDEAITASITCWDPPITPSNPA